MRVSGSVRPRPRARRVYHAESGGSSADGAGWGYILRWHRSESGQRPRPWADRRATLREVRSRERSADATAPGGARRDGARRGSGLRGGDPDARRGGRARTRDAYGHCVALARVLEPARNGSSELIGRPSKRAAPTWVRRVWHRPGTDGHLSPLHVEVAAVAAGANTPAGSKPTRSPGEHETVSCARTVARPEVQGAPAPIPAATRTRRASIPRTQGRHR